MISPIVPLKQNISILFFAIVNSQTNEITFFFESNDFLQSSEIKDVANQSLIGVFDFIIFIYFSYEM